MSGVGSAQFATAIQPVGQLRRRGTNRDRKGPLCFPSCLVSRLSSPKAAFNPHTSTALAAYCKSPYPHRSAPTASPIADSCERSGVDTALEIYRSSRIRGRTGTAYRHHGVITVTVLLPAFTTYTLLVVVFTAMARGSLPTVTDVVVLVAPSSTRTLLLGTLV
jgi:hypothetical protein